MLRWVLGTCALAAVGLLAMAALSSDEAPRRGSKVTTDRNAATEHGTSFDRLVLALQGRDLDERIQAAVALRKLGESAVPVFVTLLRDGDRDGRLIAARALEKLKLVAAPAAGDLCEALRSDDRELRLAILEALAAIRSREAVPQLLPLLVEEDQQIVRAALRTLEAIKPESEAAARAIVRLIEVEEFKTIYAARDALKAMGPAAVAVLPELIAAIERGQYPGHVIEAVEAIGPAAYQATTALIKVICDIEQKEADEKRASGGLTVLRDHYGRLPEYDARRALVAIGERAIPELLRMLHSDLWGVRYDASSILTRIGEPALPHLVAAATDPEPAVRLAVAQAFGKLVRKHPELFARLVELVKDPHLGVRGKAIEGLGSSGPRATPILLALLGDRDDGTVSAALGSLAGAAPKTSETVPLLVKLLGHKEHTIRWHAADVLGAMGEAGAAGIPALVGYLGGEDEYMRKSAGEALKKLGELAIPALMDSIDGMNAAGKQATLELLRNSKQPSAGMLGVYARMLTSESRHIRVHAAEALAATGNANPAVLPTLLDGLQSSDGTTRTSAAHGLGALGAAAVSAIPAILGAAEREDSHARPNVHYYDALEAIGRHDVSALIQALASPSWNVRYDVKSALTAIGEPAVAAVTRMAHQGTPTVQIEAIEILRASAKKVPSARDAMHALAGTGAPEVRLHSISRLWEVTRDAGFVVPQALALLAFDKTRSGAARLLSDHVGADAAFAIQEIRAGLAAATDENVRSYLKKAINKIERR